MKMFIIKTMLFNTLKKILFEIIFPQSCLICGKQGEPICLGCLSSIEIVEVNYCPFCESPHLVFDKSKCNRHKSKKLNGLFFATQYNQPIIKKIISNFKYKPYIKNLSRACVYLIIAHLVATKNKIISDNTNKNILMPIPARGKRQRERGYNQSTLIASGLSNYLNMPIAINNLIKIKRTKSQVGLSRKKREQNIKNSFMVKYPELIKDKNVFVIDDVFTTGSTMEEVAKILKRAGAKQVWGIAVAREPFIAKLTKK